MEYSFCSVLGGKLPSIFLLGFMLSPYGDKLTNITTLPQSKTLIRVDRGSIMYKIQMEWK